MMAVNGTVSQTSWTDKSTMQGSGDLKVKAVHITELRTAVNALEGMVANLSTCQAYNECYNCKQV